MATKKKLLTTVAALGTAAAVLLGGTFAWQSINQTALNEASDIVNPGGRLHDDFNGTNKDVYVENFADDDIFARIRLEEFFEIVLNEGTPGEKTVSMIGSKEQKKDAETDELLWLDDAGTIPDYEYTREIYKFDGREIVDGEGNITGVYAGYEVKDGAGTGDPWWTWTTGGETVFMPTFNVNKDSLKADINGEYRFETGVITDKDVEGGQYTTMVEYYDGETKTANAIYDIDSNQADEIDQEDLAILIDPEQTSADTYESDHVRLLSEEHTAQYTGTARLISMADWLNMLSVDESGEKVYDEAADGGYWVYDTDGWVYWSAPIHKGEATGLLLDGIELNQVMDDSWYYAINVVAQFCTAGDMGTAPVYSDTEVDADGNPVLLTPGTGFYSEEDGAAPSDEALTLLELIGVNDTTSGGGAGGDTDGDDTENPPYDIYIYAHKSEEEFTGNAAYIVPNIPYEVIVTSDTETTDTVNFDVSGVDTFGTPFEFADGDYTLTVDQETFALTDTPVTDGATEYHATATLTINNDNYVGSRVKIAATTSANVSSEIETVIQYDYLDLDLGIYDITTGERITDTLVQPNTEYDVVATVSYNGEELVVYSSNANRPVSDKIDLTYNYGATAPSVHQHSTYNDADRSYLTERGSLMVVNPDPEMGVMLDISVADLRYYEDGNKDSDTPTWRAYAYGYTKGLRIHGASPMTVYVDKTNITFEEGLAGIWMIPYEDRSYPLEGVTPTVVGAESNNTTVEVDGETLTLTLGEDETSETITVNLNKDGYESASVTFTVTYPTPLTLKVVDELAEVEKGQTYTLYVDGYDGDAANLTWSIDSDYSGVWATTESEYAMAATLAVSDSETAGELTVTVRDDVGYAYGSIILPIHYDLVVDYVEDLGDAVYIQDATYYAMHFTAALNEEGLNAIRYLKGTVYEEDGAEPLYYANENIGFVYGEATGSFFFKIPMEEYTLTDGTTYELRVEYINGTSTYAGKSLYYTYTASGDSTSNDTTAPTVSVTEAANGVNRSVTISDLSDADFPLTLKAYAQTDDAGTIADTPYSTITITLTDGTAATENTNVEDLTYAGGTLAFGYTADLDGLTAYYESADGMTNDFGLKLVVADAAGNEGEVTHTWTTGGCFVAGTQVQTESGLVNIEDIRLGDMVYSVDLSTGEKVLSPVTWVQGTRYIDATYTIYAGGEEIVTTYEHPFYVFGKEWVAAEDLTVGDKLMDMNGNEVAITNIVYTELDESVQVYNFMVDGTHNYLITESGILVHNISK